MYNRNWYLSMHNPFTIQLFTEDEQLVLVIKIIQMFTEEGLSHSRVLFMRVLYLTNHSASLNNIIIP